MGCRLDVPRHGHAVNRVAETYGKPIREAVGILAGSIAMKDSENYRDLWFGSLRARGEIGLYCTDAEMAAWAIASIWVVGIAVKAVPTTASLRNAEEWFLAGDCSKRLTDLVSAHAINRAEKSLHTFADSDVYYTLLPYILDPYGLGSRLSVERDPAMRAARNRKRASGVFYTPADVAEYMVGCCVDSLNVRGTPTIFDPACGTGVFLRAGLKKLVQRHVDKNPYFLASECLFGVDIDPWSLDASAFVLFADVWSDVGEQHCSPASVWSRLRLNLRCIDALRIDPYGWHLDNDHANGANVRRISLSGLFPALNRNPTVIVGNPPYSDLGKRPDLGQLVQVFKTLSVKPRPNAELYLSFIEQMTRLADKVECAGALVLPLSIACNIGPQFVVTRHLIQETVGHWRFAFFDREPHALFGEDVKTRNAIVFWLRNELNTNTMLASGPLRKWRSRSRSAMFNDIRFTRLAGDIRAGIPKIDGDYQAAALKKLNTRWDRLEQAVQRIDRQDLAAAPSADDRIVFVGPTAYNFLNVFLRPPHTVFEEGLRLSKHPLHAIRCASSDDALAVFGILSSHLAYWWWRTHGDGFHVLRRFISEFPFGREVLRDKCVAKICESAAALWEAIREKPIISLNRGRSSLAYTPNGYDGTRRNADEVLASIAALDNAFVDDLQQFTAHNIAAKVENKSGCGVEE